MKKGDLTAKRCAASDSLKTFSCSAGKKFFYISYNVSPSIGGNHHMAGQP